MPDVEDYGKEVNQGMRLANLLAVTLLGLFFAGGSMLAHSVEEGAWHLVLSTDFDGDGQDDSVLGKATDYPNVYSRVRVEAAAGATLLDTTDQSLFYEVQAGRITAPFPILLVGSPSGNWLQIETFMYQPMLRSMRRLSWDGEPWVRGRQPLINENDSAIAVWVEWRGQEARVTYRYVAGQLMRVRPDRGGGPD